MVEHNQHDSESYLSNLKFDPSLKEHWWAKYITNIRWVILLIVTILILGVASYTSLPTRLNPQINIAIVTVNTILPGAGPEDIETLLTKPIEKELDGVKGVSSMTSSAVYTGTAANVVKEILLLEEFPAASFTVKVAMYAVLATRPVIFSLVLLSSL